MKQKLKMMRAKQLGLGVSEGLGIGSQRLRVEPGRPEGSPTPAAVVTPQVPVLI